mmetsp:Transcript_16241/g.51894  ORF Transcript_16241/g.51894 Transcript_16241/m.51894 type:complete len:227 (+) Transcript_16241:1548-2228(+)
MRCGLPRAGWLKERKSVGGEGARDPAARIDDATPHRRLGLVQAAHLFLLRHHGSPELVGEAHAAPRLTDRKHPVEKHGAHLGHHQCNVRTLLPRGQRRVLAAIWKFMAVDLVSVDIPRDLVPRSRVEALALGAWGFDHLLVEDAEHGVARSCANQGGEDLLVEHRLTNPLGICPGVEVLREVYAQRHGGDSCEEEKQKDQGDAGDVEIGGGPVLLHFAEALHARHE